MQIESRRANWRAPTSPPGRSNFIAVSCYLTPAPFCGCHDQWMYPPVTPKAGCPNGLDQLIEPGQGAADPRNGDVAALREEAIGRSWALRAGANKHENGIRRRHFLVAGADPFAGRWGGTLAGRVSGQRAWPRPIWSAIPVLPCFYRPLLSALLVYRAGKSLSPAALARRRFVGRGLLVTLAWGTFIPWP